jgi:hypothetical protein
MECWMPGYTIIIFDSFTPKKLVVHSASDDAHSEQAYKYMANHKNTYTN